ncbi:hypothetical protein H5410_015692 [Solanum commersonii]|uniref:Reverse transcriptase zinc-binding domain-containing protein n=1 Tax=Solanum commersonii TaxID=4109 RepID=A0A9J5ZV59_SOLCO|nr:hypothetical protein H5410_015692 [Solanum commersonii]
MEVLSRPSKFMEHDNWITKPINSTYGVSLWRSTRILWPGLRNQVSIGVLNGRLTSFWNDIWLWNGALKDLFCHICSNFMTNRDS